MPVGWPSAWGKIKEGDILEPTCGHLREKRAVGKNLPRVFVAAGERFSSVKL